jgi:hypothetical protein
MKITSEKSYKTPDGQIDFMSMVNDLQQEYDEVYWNTIDNQIFIYRALGRREYRQLLQAELSEIEVEDTVCQACLLYPKDFDFENCVGGIPTELFRHILSNSFLDSIDSKKLVITHFRAEMQEFDNQITCIINEAFPNFDIEEIENWDMAKTAKYLSRAEWKLNILRNIPIDYDQSDKLMEQEWAIQHSKKDDNQDVAPEPKEEPVQNQKQTKARKKTKEEMEEFKRRFPELKWDFEVDPNESIDSMKDDVSDLPVALRVPKQ